MYLKIHLLSMNNISSVYANIHLYGCSADKNLSSLFQKCGE